MDFKEPVRHTCPDIDNAIGDAKNIVKECRDHSNDMERYADNIMSILEDLRRDNEALRTWGNDLALYAQDLEKEIEELKKHESKERISD